MWGAGGEALSAVAFFARTFCDSAALSCIIYPFSSPRPLPSAAVSKYRIIPLKPGSRFVKTIAQYEPAMDILIAAGFRQLKLPEVESLAVGATHSLELAPVEGPENLLFW